MPRYLILVALLYSSAGCSAAFLEGFADGLERGSAARSGGQSGSRAIVSQSARGLMLFGGRGHDTYLGCLSCSEYDSDSIFNEYGQYGSRYGDTILNPYSDYGSRYSDQSVCNPYASDPPVIVDDDGGFYGRLSVSNLYTSTVVTPEVSGWLKGICAR